MKTIRLDDYRTRVRKAATHRDGEPFVNTSLDHAAIVVEHIFPDAVRRVDILSKNLNPEVYGRKEVTRQAIRFLDDPNREIRVLLEEDDQQARANNPFLSECGQFDNLRLHFVPTSVQKRYDFHFLVTDRDSYRFEPDKTNAGAVVAFGNPQNASHLSDIFNTIWKLSGGIE